MSSTNADSMTNAQGEFQPKVPRSEPLTTKGHQVGQQVGNDAVPEFHAKTLPAGTAPAKSTYKPNPINETPGQANNPDVDRSHGKERTRTNALDFPGATSADVHIGLGHPGSGQTSAESRHEGKSHRERDAARFEGTGATGGSGLRGDDDLNTGARRLQEDHVTSGPRAAQEHNTSLLGAEGKESVRADQVAGEKD